MLYNCLLLNEINISNFKINKLTDIILGYWKKINQLIIPSFNINTINFNIDELLSYYFLFYHFSEELKMKIRS